MKNVVATKLKINSNISRYILLVTDSNYENYEIEILTDSKNWIRMIVPVNPILYDGRTTKSFMGYPEADGWRFKEIDGPDTMAFRLLLNIGRYDGIKENKVMMYPEIPPKVDKELAEICIKLHNNSKNPAA